jgi:tetratricopeptide (TPR) repeat protein
MKKVKIIFTFLLLSSVFNIHAQEAEDLLRQGQQKLEMGNPSEALDLYTEAIQLDPNYLDAHLKRAFVYSMLNEHEKAILDYDRIVELNPQNSDIYVSRGSAYNRLNQFEKAMVDFNKAIEIDRTNSDAFNNRGWAKKGLGDKKGACSDWKKSKKLGNEEARIILINNQC